MDTEKSELDRLEAKMEKEINEIEEIDAEIKEI